MYFNLLMIQSTSFKQVNIMLFQVDHTVAYNEIKLLLTPESKAVLSGDI